MLKTYSKQISKKDELLALLKKYHEGLSARDIQMKLPPNWFNTKKPAKEVGNALHQLRLGGRVKHIEINDIPGVWRWVPVEKQPENGQVNDDDYPLVDDFLEVNAMGCMGQDNGEQQAGGVIDPRTGVVDLVEEAGGVDLPGFQAAEPEPEPVDSVGATLNERENRYGRFSGHATITQSIKREMAKGKRWGELSDSQKEALEMIAHKIGRVLNGDPNYSDSWHDIAGYAALVDRELSQQATT